MQNSIDALFGALLVFSIAACGQSGIRNAIVTSEKICRGLRVFSSMVSP